jgi:hypothetical protein
MTFAFPSGRSVQASGLPHGSAILVKQLVLAVAFLAGSAAVANARETVTVDRALEAGTVVIRTSEKRLYFVLGNGTAIRYRVAVGRPGKQWFGRLVVDGKYRAPAWTPYVAEKKPPSLDALRCREEANLRDSACNSGRIAGQSDGRGRANSVRR